MRFETFENIMRKIIVTNAFSLNMLSGHKSVNIHPFGLENARLMLADCNWESAVGHADTARVFSRELGVEIPFNRTTIQIEDSSVLLVGQYKGPRLPEGATELPKGATIEWTLVKVYGWDRRGLNFNSPLKWFKKNPESECVYNHKV